jgi:3-dehydroquinate dehydratase II
MRVLVLNGPNLDMLGAREPEVYGSFTLSEIEAELSEFGSSLGLEIDLRQTNSESELISWLHDAFEAKTPVVLNPAAFTHYSYALRDACAMLSSRGIKLIEVHISNPHARESFRHHSVISGVATGVIAGFGVSSYSLALQALVRD